MGLITDFLRQDHGHCDQLYVAAERLAADADLHEASVAFGDFASALLHHFSMEEDVLFPAFEDVAGEGGPSFVMRHEHAQMRELLKSMETSLAQARVDDFLAFADTLLVLMQQHNVKEERMLYPMTDRMLGNPEAVLARMQGM